MKEQIKWQFAEDYYKRVVIPKMQKITEFYHYRQYPAMLSIMETMFCEVANAIQEHLGTQEEQKFQESFDRVSEKITKLELLKTRLQSPEQARATLLLNHEIEKEVKAIYKALMADMDKMNMLFPRHKVDTDLPIYQQ